MKILPTLKENIRNVFENLGTVKQVFVSNTLSKESFPLILRGVFALLMLYTILNIAWIGDDPLITFRQISNFINGDGITFNYETRVQAFTHPTWFLLLSSIIFLTGEYFLTTLLLSVLLSMLSVFLLFFLEKNLYINKLPRFSPIFILMFSWAFCDYTTSGLENALSFFLVGCLLYIHSLGNKKIYSVYIFIVLSLLVLNRLDYVLLFFPYVIVVLYDIKKIKTIIYAVLPGSVILIVWFSFATIYFGSPLPNTYFAKILAGYPTDEIYDRGLDYFRSLLRYDMVTVLTIITAIIFSFISFNRHLISFGLGIILYCFYIYSSGGDFMSGRFFSVLLFLSVGILVYLYSTNMKIGQFNIQSIIAIIFLLVIYSGLFDKYPTLSPEDFGTNESRTIVNLRGVIDERAFYYRSFGLLSKYRKDWPKVIEAPKEKPTEYRLFCGGVGITSIKHPDIYIVDQCALVDPYLARIPAIHSDDWRIGHHLRKIPTNFGEYILGNEVNIADRILKNLFEDINLISSNKNYFTIERFGAILRLNTGYYNKLDLVKYSDKNIWIPSTTKLERIVVEQKYIKRFPLNEKFEIIFSKPRYTNKILLDFFHNELTYKVFVNNTHVGDIYRGDGCETRVLRLSDPRIIRSIRFNAVKALSDARFRTTHVKSIRLMDKNEKIPNIWYNCIYNLPKN